MRLEHPQLGELRLYREKLAVSGHPGQMLVIYHAKPESPDAEKLQLLDSLTTPSLPTTPDLKARPAGPQA